MFYSNDFIFYFGSSCKGAIALSEKRIKGDPECFPCSERNCHFGCRTTNGQRCFMLTPPGLILSQASAWHWGIKYGAETESPRLPGAQSLVCTRVQLRHHKDVCSAIKMHAIWHFVFYKFLSPPSFFLSSSQQPCKNSRNVKIFFLF